MGINITKLTNENRKQIKQVGNFSVIEHVQDLSVTPDSAIRKYYQSLMNVRKRQVIIQLNGNGATVQAGAMQWMAGNIQLKSGIKGAGDLVGKMFTSKMTGETAVKPEYTGNGLVMLEPTYKHIILKDMKEFGGTIVLEDGLFLACDSNIQQKVIARNNLSSAALGGEGLFNLMLQGNGVVALEAPYPEEELIEITLQNDTLKIDGNQAICWSPSLQFTTEKAGTSYLGSAASGEGWVNVFRGTGKIIMSPVASSRYSVAQTA